MDVKSAISSVKRISSSLLILLCLFPAISIGNDEIYLNDILLDADRADEAILRLSHASDRNHSLILATLLDQLAHAQIASVFVLTPEPVYDVLSLSVTADFCSRYITVPGERGPPFALAA